MEIHHTTIQRLAFSKYLYNLAIEQSKAPELMSAASLLTFHDAIEFFLQISSEHIGAGSKQTGFMEYWGIFSQKLDIPEFPQKESMRRLNKARVALKHHGTLPSKLDIEAFRAASNLFFEEATRLVFEMEFVQISLIEYVSPEEARNHLKQAEQLCLTKSFENAAIEVVLAFEKMLFAYKKNISGHDTPFFFGNQITPLTTFRIKKNSDREMGDFVGKVQTSVDAMQKAIEILALGLDYRKYSKFRHHLPHVSRRYSGEYRVQNTHLADRELIDKEYIEFCINYVVECAIKLNEFNYEVR